MKAEIEIHNSAIIDEGAVIGDGTKIWHWAHICSGAKIGKHVSVGQNVFIGNKTLIQRVYEQALQSNAKEVLVATDSEEIISHCSNNNIDTIETEIGIPIDSMHHPPNIAAETPSAPRDKFKPPVSITTIIAKPIIISIATTLDRA